MNDGKEKRHYIRFPFKYPIEHRLKGDTNWNLSSCDNISMGGLMFFSSKKYTEGNTIELIINFDKKSNEYVIPFIAEVIWIFETKADTEKYITGIEFKFLSAKQQKIIQKLVNLAASKIKDKIIK